MATNFLAELVDHPVERLDVEYKSTLDLTENKHRAALARHIAAIANFGGGYIVFGFDDETLTPCAEMPADFSVDRDLVGGITSKYLDPSLHCDVDLVEAMTGRRHFVITVPAHGSEPVCAKAGAPDNKGLIVGTYYTRKAGPKSEPITAASEWKDIIRRCALHERAAILSAVTAALTDATLSKPERGPSIVLDKWSEAARTAYFAAIGDKTFHVPLRECHMQFSYLIELSEPQTLALQGFHDLARTVANQVEDNIKSGWPLFGVFGEAPAAPRWAHDPAAGETDFLQADFLSGTRSIGYDYWRLAPSGMASVLREFWEDTPDFKRGC